MRDDRKYPVSFYDMGIMKFFRTWTLPISMLTGAAVYMVFASTSFLNPLKPFMYNIIDVMTPLLIFTMLFLTFCRVSAKELHIVRWHVVLLVLQIAGCIAGYFIFLPISKVIAQSVMVCIICPTATAAAVITGKLGGSVPNLTTYTLLSNLMASIAVPVIFPLVEPHEGIGFFGAFTVILRKVFSLLICPFILACVIREYFKDIHRLLVRFTDLPFYLWAVSLAIVTGQTVKSLVHSGDHVLVEIGVAAGALLACLIQFWAGRRIGRKYNDTISAGQALGQKNTVLAIWMAYTYLNPLSSVGPGSYVLWQNIINSLQLWRKQKKEQERKG